MLNPPTLTLVCVSEKDYLLSPHSYTLPTAGEDMPHQTWVRWDDERGVVVPLDEGHPVIAGYHGLTVHPVRRGEPALVKCLLEVAVLNRYVVSVWIVEPEEINGT